MCQGWELLSASQGWGSVAGQQITCCHLCCGIPMTFALAHKFDTDLAGDPYSFVAAGPG